MPPAPDQCVRFGEFELNPRAGELRRNGTTVGLGEQPLRVLTVLLERRGEVVTREELRDRLWPADTFVDFEHGLNAAVKRLRDALGDSADTPRFIETIPRRGYRFIASPPSPDARDNAGSPARERWRWHGWSGGLALFVALGALLLMLGGLTLLRMSRASEPAPSGAPPLRASLDTPPGLLRTIVFSPDGRHLAATSEEELLDAELPPLPLSIWVRRATDVDWRRVAALAQTTPWIAWTPDSRALVYVSAGELRAIDLETGVSRLLARTSGESPLSLRDGSTLVGGRRLIRVGRDGDITDEGPADDNVHAIFPAAELPDGRVFIAQIAAEPESSGIFLCAPGLRPCSRVLADLASISVAVRGQLVYRIGGALFSQPFDAARGQVIDRPEPIVTGVAPVHGSFTLSPEGTLVWQPDARAKPDTALVWFDRRGQTLTTIGPGGPYRQIDLSPDGSHVVLERDGDPGLEVLDLSRGVLEPLVFKTRPALVADPVWAPDGRRLAVATAAPFKQARPAIVDVTGAELEVTHTFASGGWPEVWAMSPEGEFLIYVLEEGTASGLWAAPVSGTGAAKRLTPEGPQKYDQGQLSADGRWLAYVSDETGRFEVWVQPFGRNGPRRRLSTTGGGQPRWRRDGRELFYLTGDGAMMSVALSAAMEPSSPRELFKSGIDPQPVLDRYVVSPDGQRFLAIVPAGAPPRPQLAVLVNWQPGRAGR